MTMQITTPMMRNKKNSLLSAIVVTLCFVLFIFNTHFYANIQQDDTTAVVRSVAKEDTGCCVPCNDGDGGDDDTRPWMIIHVGPPKTATTTIQAGLAKYAKMLAKDDDFYFLGHTAG